MIYITGDTHGDIDYKKLLTLKEKNLSYSDFLIICGDAGICWSHQEFQYFLNLYNDIGCTIIFNDCDKLGYTFKRDAKTKTFRVMLKNPEAEAVAICRKASVSDKIHRYLMIRNGRIDEKKRMFKVFSR